MKRIFEYLINRKLTAKDANKHNSRRGRIPKGYDIKALEKFLIDKSKSVSLHIDSIKFYNYDNFKLEYDKNAVYPEESWDSIFNINNVNKYRGNHGFNTTDEDSVLLAVVTFPEDEYTTRELRTYYYHVCDYVDDIIVDNPEYSYLYDIHKTNTYIGCDGRVGFINGKKKIKETNYANDIIFTFSFEPVLKQKFMEEIKK